jgi:hypothetical protein
MSKFDGVDAILGDLVNGPRRFDRVPGSPRKPPIEGFGLWAGATAPPAAAPTPRPVVRKLERGVFDAPRGDRLERRSWRESGHARETVPAPAVAALKGFAGLDRLDDNLDCADNVRPEAQDERMPLADDPALFESLAILDCGVFGEGGSRDRRSDEGDSVTPELPVPLADDPALLEGLASLDQGVFGDASAHDGCVQEYELKAQLIAPGPDGLAELDRLDDNLDSADAVKAEPDPELVALADDPGLLEGLEGLDRGVFGDSTPHDRRIQQYELKARLIAPETPKARPSRRSTDLPGLVAKSESVRVHRWVATAAVALAISLGATAAACVFQEQVSRIAVRWSGPAQTAPATDSCAAADCRPERNR